MKEFWFYIEPYAFVFEGKKRILVYNTLNGSATIVSQGSRAAEILKKVQCSERYGMTLSEVDLQESTVAKLIIDLRQAFSADIIDTNNLKGLPFSFKPVLDLLNDPVKSITEESNHFVSDSILSYLHELNIYLDNECCHQCPYCHITYKQNSFCTTFKGDCLSLEKYKDFFLSVTHLGLKKVNMFTNNVNIDFLKSIIFLANSCDLIPILYIHFLNVDQQFIDLISNKDCQLSKIIILFDSTLIKNWKNIIPNCEWCFVVKSEKELTDTISLIDTYNLNAEIKPVYTGDNMHFFENYVYILKDDVLEHPISKQEIFIKQTINSIFFGKLSVTPNGDIFASLNEKLLGNILHNSLREAIYKELKYGRNWLYTRNEGECKECELRWLCPSPSNYERIIGKTNLCNIV